MGNLGLGLALFSYDGMLSWGYSGDWDLIPDLHELVVATEESFAELKEAAGLAPASETSSNGRSGAESEGKG